MPLAAALNGAKGELAVLNRRRGFVDDLEPNLRANNVDRATVDAMTAAVVESLPEFRRYFRAKGRLLGHADGLPWWDLFAPVGDKSEVSWDNATALVLDAFGGYSPDLAGLATRAFSEHWVDAEIRDGKRGGAYCASVDKRRQPRDDELRRQPRLGVDARARARPRVPQRRARRAARRCSGACRWRSPRPRRSSARRCCSRARSVSRSNRRRARLAILDTYLVGASQVVVDIHSRFLFESELCRRRRRTSVSVAELNAMMLDAQDAAYGDGLDARHRHPYMWAVKPHYFTPFYNWPYTFGLLFGIGLYAKYTEDPERFRAGYDDLLSGTGMADAATLTGRVRVRRARSGVLGVEPRGDRPPHRRLRAAWSTPTTERDARRRAARGGRGATVHRLGLLLAGRSHAGRTAVGLHADRARRGAAGSPDLLDMGTGGGEWLADLPVRPRAHGRDGSVAAERRRSRRGTSVQSVCRSCETKAPPTTSVRPTLMPTARPLAVPRPARSTSSSTATRRSWRPRSARVLAPDGTFVTQQVDNGNLDDLYRLLERAGAPPRPVVAAARGRADRRRRARDHRRARRRGDLPLRRCRRAGVVRRGGRAAARRNGPTSRSTGITTHSSGSTHAPAPGHRSSSGNAGCSCRRTAPRRGERRVLTPEHARGASPRTRAGLPSRPPDPITAMPSGCSHSNASASLMCSVSRNVRRMASTASGPLATISCRELRAPSRARRRRARRAR